MMPFPHDRILLARIGEISLKGLNRGNFEARLVGNIQRRLRSLGDFSVLRSQSVIRIQPSEPDGFDFEEALRRISCIFGIVSVSPARSFSGGFDDIVAQSVEHMGPLLADGKRRTFKIEARRSDKSFPQDSPTLCREVGYSLLTAFPAQLAVDVHHPEITLRIEIRDSIYLFDRVVKGHRGLPVGTSGRALLLLSGGIDSPVAGYLMAGRGMELECVHFHSMPFTSERAIQKVMELAAHLTAYTGRLRVHLVSFTAIQTLLRDHVPEEMLTICMRRAMMRVAERIAEATFCKALVTGESLGQVASQTLDGLCTTDAVVSMPVFRPLIGLDKDSTVEYARRIGTFETSIQPFEDCCTLFVAKHPRTRPTPVQAEFLEKDLPLDACIADAVRDRETRVVS